MSGWLPDFLIAVSPLLLLVGLLVLGCYPGERALHGLRRILTLVSFPRAHRAPLMPILRVPLFRLRGGRLLADSLAGRGPPAG